MNYSKNISQVKFNQNKVLFNEKSVKLELTEMNETFGKWLKRLRKKRGLNQPELAKLAHTTKATISLLEADKIAQPRFEKLENIAKALGLSPAEIRAVYAEKSVSPQNSSLPEPLLISDFDGFDKEDIKDIKEYIKFKKSQKAQNNAQQ